MRREFWVLLSVELARLSLVGTQGSLHVVLVGDRRVWTSLLLAIFISSPQPAFQDEQRYLKSTVSDLHELLTRPRLEALARGILAIGPAKRQGLRHLDQSSREFSHHRQVRRGG